MLLVWTENLRVGVEEFDEDHRGLISMVNELHRAVQSGESRRTLAAVLDRMEWHTRDHCRREEQFFVSTCYPDLEAHRQEHRQLVCRLADLRKRFEASADPHLAVETMELIFQWLTDHIHGTDRLYGPHLNSNGIY